MHTGAEAEFLATYESGKFAKPSVTADIVLLGIQENALRTILVRRASYPHRGRSALPGGFVRLDESLDAAAERVLNEKAPVRGVFLEQLYTFGQVNRDPRIRIISVAYYALVQRARLDSVVATENTQLFTIELAPSGALESLEVRDDRGDIIETAFDHGAIIATAVRRLRGKLAYAPVSFPFLPAQFTLYQLQRVHEIILNARVNKDSFRRKVLASGEIEPTGAMQEVVDHRPAALYRRNRQRKRHD